ncbi:diguanylate cyclase domain-containing protein [Frankia sp. AgPm24]|uniref:diguanylate cyclase domain-containing protein n=1 Tax=Frankia sp. AgPm24 TaxID=631128 RepID=UPI00200F4A94|nr:diguanylate cyclase [Frankia sp. AgPm24]
MMSRSDRSSIGARGSAPPGSTAPTGSTRDAPVVAVAPVAEPLFDPSPGTSPRRVDRGVDPNSGWDTGRPPASHRESGRTVHLSAPPTARRLTPTMRIWLVIALVSCAVICPGVLLLPDTVAPRVLRAVIAVVLLLACAVAVRTGCRARGRHRTWRLLVAAVDLAIGLAALAAVFISPTRGPLSDQLHLGYDYLLFLPIVGCALVALLAYPIHAPGAAAERRVLVGHRWWLTTLLDSLIVVGSVNLLAWALFLHRIVDNRVGDTEHFVTALVLCVFSQVLVCTTALLWIFRRPAATTGFVLLSVALTGISASLLLYTANVAVQHVVLRSGSEIAWLLASWCLLLACLAPEHAPARARADVGASPGPGPFTKRWAHILLPLLPLATASLIALVDVSVGGGLDVVDVVALLALPVLVLARQMITLADNVGLLHRLESSEQRLQQQAYHDPLTGLANRALFADRLHAALAGQRDDGRSFAVIYVDLDDFKRVNDTLGHAAGDRLLQVTGSRLTHAVRAGDTVARLGGDEFAILLVPGGDTPATIGSRVLAAVRAPTVLSGVRHSVRASVGLVVAEAWEEPSSESLLHRADAAMYAAKRAGKGSLTLYDPSLENNPASMSPRVALLRALRGDPGEGSLRMRYSPVVDVRDGHAVGAKAQLRWCHPEHGDLPAVTLVPTNEQTQLIPLLTAAALARVVADLPRLRASPTTPPPVYLPILAGVPVAATVLDALRAAMDDGSLRPEEVIADLYGAERGFDIDSCLGPLNDLIATGIDVGVADFGAADANLMIMSILPITSVTVDHAVSAIWLSPHLNRRHQAIRDHVLRIMNELDEYMILTNPVDADAAARAVGLGLPRAISTDDRAVPRAVPVATAPPAPMSGIRDGPPR